jgi:hypothetical protein
VSFALLLALPSAVLFCFAVYLAFCLALLFVENKASCEGGAWRKDIKAALAAAE